MAYVLGLGIAEAPYLVTLNPAGWNISNGFVVVVRAGFPMASTNSRVTVFRDTPMTRVMDRIEEPSTSMLSI